MTFYVLSVITAIGTVNACVFGVLLKRQIVRDWRRFLVRLELERCENERAVFCGRELR